MAMKFRNLQICKILKTDTNRQSFSISFQGYVHRIQIYKIWKTIS